MRIIIAGGHGKVARSFGEIVSPHHEVVGLIRDGAQAADLEAIGMRAMVADLEATTPGDLARIIHGSDAFVFAAGAGPGSGAARKETVDYGAAAKSVRAAGDSGVKRFLMVSAMGTDHPPDDDTIFSVYLRAKARADATLMDSNLDWTVVRPGRLTDRPGTGRVRLARRVPRGDIPRRDVAGVLAESLTDARTVGRVFEVVGGDTPIEEALASLAESEDQ